MMSSKCVEFFSHSKPALESLVLRIVAIEFNADECERDDNVDSMGGRKKMEKLKNSTINYFLQYKSNAHILIFKSRSFLCNFMGQRK